MLLKLILLLHFSILFLFIINYANANQNNDQFASSSYMEESMHFAIAEESPSPLLITVIPPSISGFSKWRIAASNPLFSFNPNSGELFTNSHIDREQLPIDPENGKCFLRTILLSQGINGTRLIRINAEILDVNDNAPILTNQGQKEMTLSILESASIGSRLWLGTARDADFGENGTIGGFELELEENEAKKLFRPEKGESGELSLELMGKLDREKQQIYKGKMRIWDEGMPTKENKMALYIRILDANDNPPQFEKSNYELILPMKQPLMIKAIDTDEGVNGQIHYKIVNNDEMGDSIKIDAKSGLLSWNGNRICAGNSSKCKLIVEAWDQGQPSLNARTQINIVENEEEMNNQKINERKKTFITKIRNLPNGQPFAVFDENAKNGSVLAILSIEMEKNGHEKSEEIEEGKLKFEMKGNDHEKYRIERIGRIGLLRLNSNEINDDGKNEWNLTIFINFNEEIEEKIVQIFMRPPNDSAPILISPIQKVHFPENASIGTLLARIEVKNELNNQIKYELVENEWSNYVEIHPIAGLLRLRKFFPKLEPGIAKREFTIYVDLFNPAPSLAKSKAQIQIEIFDVNDNIPQFLDCPLASSICSFSTNISEDHPLERPLLTPNVRDNDAGQNAQIHFSLRSFNKLDFMPFRVDQKGNIFLTRRPIIPLNLHRFLLKIEDNGEPKRSSEALIEISIKEINNSAPSFPEPSIAFISLRHSQPANSRIFQARAINHQLNGLGYILLDSPIVELFKLEHSNGWLSLAKSVANSDLTIGSQLILKIGAINKFNLTSPKPLELNIRIVADSSKVPPAFAAGIIQIPTIRHLPPPKDCLKEEELLKEMGGFFDGQMILKISPLNDNFATFFTWSNSSRNICFNDAPIPSSNSPIPFLIDFGQNGWAMGFFEQKMPSECSQPKFANPPSQFSIQIGTSIGHQLHRFRIKNPPKYCQKLRENIKFELSELSFDLRPKMPLEIDPKKGILWFIGWPNGRETNKNILHFVVTMKGPNSIKTIHPFSLIIQQNFVDQIPPSYSILFSNLEGHLRPGDLLANIRNEFKLSEGNVYFNILTNQGEIPLSNWEENSVENFIELFPNGELRFVGKIPTKIGTMEWKKEIKIEWKWKSQFLLNQIVNLSVYIQNPTIPSSSTLKCPEIRQKFIWQIDSPPGTILGKLGRENCHLCRIKLIGPENGLFVDEGNGKLITRQMNPAEEGGRNIALEYRLMELINGMKNELTEIECKAIVEIVAVKNGQKRGKQQMRNILRKKLTYLDASKMAKKELELALVDFSKEFGKIEGIVHQFVGHNQFEIQNGNELFLTTTRSLAHFRPFYLLEGKFDDAKIAEIRLQILPPFPEEINVFELKSSAGTNISISFSAAKIGSILSQISVHPFSPEFSQFFQHSNFSIKFKIQKIEPIDEEGIFGICPISGRIFFAKNVVNLAKEKNIKIFLMEIVAEEEFSLANGKIKLRIEIGGMLNGGNGEETIHPKKIYKFEIMENAEIGQKISQIDECKNNEWNSVEELPFSIENGILSVNGKIDAEENAFYSFPIQIDGDLNIQIEIIILDQNEHTPTLLNRPNGPIKVPENAKIGTKIFKLELADADLIGNPLAKIDQFRTDYWELFFIDSEGWIRLANELDREIQEEHELELNICDGNAFNTNKVLCSPITLDLIILDVNDNAPQFWPTNKFQFIVEENSPIGTIIGNLRANDPDLGQNGTTHFRIVPKTMKNDQLFIVDPVFGYLKVNAKIDREKIGNELKFRIQAFDQGIPPMISEAEIVVRILDIDDNAPELENTQMNISINENALPGIVLARLGCEDMDEGTNGMCLFDIVDPIGGEGQYFHLGKASGLLRLANSLMGSKRREHFQLNTLVSPFSGKWPSKQMNIKIDVIPANQPPHFGVDQKIPILIESIPPNSMPIFLRRIQAIDPDSGQNGSITYSIIDGHSTTEYFALNPQNGQLTLAKQIAEEGDYNLRILALDGGQPPLSATLNLLIRIYGPKFEQMPFWIIPPIHSIHLVEYSPPKEIIQLKAIPREGIQFLQGQIPAIRFHFDKIICEDGIWRENFQNWPNLFHLDQIEGRLSILASLDAKSCGFWRIRIGAEVIIISKEGENNNFEEAQNLEENSEILIFVDKNGEKIDGNLKMMGGPGDVFMPSNAKPGDAILALNSAHEDGSQISIFGEDSTQFMVDKNGELLKLAKELPKGKEEFTIQIGKNANNINSMALRIYTAQPKYFPQFLENSSNSLILPQKANPLIPLAKLNAIFPAKNDSTHQILYSILGGDQCEQFRIDPFNGEIYWFPSFGNSSILPDQLQIVATNTFGPFSTLHSLKIIPNLNESNHQLECQINGLGLPYLRMEWPENEAMENNHQKGGLAKIGVKNGKGPFEFKFLNWEGIFNIGEYFGINQSTGIVHLTKTLDRELTEWIRLKIGAKSKNGGEGICILDLNVLDQNDNPPRFGHILNLKLNESTKFPSKIYQIEVEDGDKPENAKNIFSLMECQQNENDCPFQLEPNGELILTKKLDFEKQSEYRLQISAHDDGEWEVQSGMQIQIIKSEMEIKMEDKMPKNISVPIDVWLENEMQTQIGKREQKIGKIEIGNGNGFEEEWIWNDPQNGNIYADFGLAQFLGENLDNEKNESIIIVHSNFGQQIRIHFNQRNGTTKKEINQTNIKLANKRLKFESNLNLFDNNLWPRIVKIWLNSMPKKVEQIGRIFVDGIDEENEKWKLEIKSEMDAMIELKGGGNGGGEAILVWKGGECAKLEGGIVAIKIEAKNENGGILDLALLILFPSTPLPSPLQFLQSILHFRISRHSPPSSIIGNLHKFDNNNNNLMILLHQKANSLIGIDQLRGELILIRNIRPNDSILQQFSAILATKDGKFRSKSCMIRILFLDNLPPFPIFPSKNYNVQIPIDDNNILNWQNGTIELLAFNFNLPKGAKMGIEEPPFNELFCFHQNVQPTLSICQSNHQNNISIPELLRKYSILNFHLKLAIFDQFGQIRSRTIVKLEFINKLFPEKRKIIPFNVGFIPENAPAGQNIIQIPTTQNGHWIFLDKQMENLFKLNSTTGIISTIRQIPTKHHQLLYPIELFSNSNELLFLISVDKLMQNEEEIMNLPIDIFIPIFNNSLEEILIEELFPSSSNCEIHEWKEAKLWPNCSFSLNLMGKQQKIELANKFRIHLQYFEFNEWNRFIQIGAICTQKSMAFLLKEIANSVPDLSILVPIALNDGQTDQKDFPHFQQFLFALRDPNGQTLPAKESMAILEHFSNKNPEKLHSNIFNFQMQKMMPGGICRGTENNEECLKMLSECLSERRKRRGINGGNIAWAPVEMDYSSCLLTIPQLPNNNSNPSFECSPKGQPSSPILEFESIYQFSHSSSIQIFDANQQFEIKQISIKFATRKPRVLLLYWPIEGNKFISVDLINGKIRMNYFGDSLESNLLGETVNDGNWKELNIWFGQKQIWMILNNECDHINGKCHQCAYFGECQMRMALKNKENWRISSLFLGGISIDSTLPAGTMSTMTFFGCIRQIQFNGLDLAKELPFIHPKIKIMLNGISTCEGPNAECPFFGGTLIASKKGCQSEEATQSCQGGICVPNEGQMEGESEFSCICTQIGGFEAANCSDAVQSIHFPSGPIQLGLTQFAHRQLSFIPLAGNLVHNLTPKIDEQIQCENDERGELGKVHEEFTKTKIQWMEMDFRGNGDRNGILMCAKQIDGKLATIEVNNDGAEYNLLNGKNSIYKLNLPAKILGGQWHRIGIEICPNGKMIRLKLDENVEKVAKNEQIGFFPQPMSSKLDSIWLGGCPPHKGIAHQNNINICVRRLIINNQLQTISTKFSKMPLQKEFFQIISPKNGIGECREDCPSFECSPNENNFTIRMAIIFSLILLPILVIFSLAFLNIGRRRKLKKIAKKCHMTMVESNSNSGKISKEEESKEEMGRTNLNLAAESEYSTISNNIRTAEGNENKGTNSSTPPMTTIKSGRHSNLANFICSSSDFSSSTAGFPSSSSASQYLEELNGGNRVLDLLMAEDNSNFYQDVLLDWSHAKNYVNWPPPPPLK